MNCKKTFSFLGQFSFFCRNFQDLGCQSTIKLKNNRRKNAPVYVFDQWFTIQNGFYVIYERKLIAFCCAKQNGGPQRLSRPAVQSDYFPFDLQIYTVKQTTVSRPNDLCFAYPVFRALATSQKKSWKRVRHCTWEICRFTQRKNRSTSYSRELGT